MHFPKIFQNFTQKELACPLTDEFAFHPGFAQVLQRLRTMYGKPIHVNSCCRSEEYNSRLPNSSKRSLHIYDHPKRGAKGTCAIDIALHDSIDRARLIKLALNMDFSLYLINENAIHLDLRVLLGEKQVFWI